MVSSKSFPPAPLSTASSKSKSPDPDPEIVPLSNSVWTAKLPASGAIPPPTTDTFAWALPELNVSVSPSAYPVPAASTKTCVTPPSERSCTCILAPAPAPPVIVASSPTVNVTPSFVIVVSEITEAIVNFTSVFSSALLVPVNCDPRTKVPDVVSLLICNSIISTAPSLVFKTRSTIAVAKLILVSEGSFACVIVWPTKVFGSFNASVSVWVARINVFVVNLPSDTLSISTVGKYTSAVWLNNNLKSVLWALAVPFAL